jgi:predicted Zn-dependent protease
MVWLRYAECLSALKDVSGAVAAYEKVVSAVPNHFAACVALSILYQQLGQPNDAVRVLLHHTSEDCKFQLSVDKQ